MNSKRAQSEIITTVLIILLVLAAIIIVWQVVSGTVGGASKKSQTLADCTNTGLSISSAIWAPAIALPAPGVPAHIDVVLAKSGASNTIAPSNMIILTYNNNGSSVTGCTNGNVANATKIPTAAFAQDTVTLTPCALLAGSTYIVKIAPVIGTQNCEQPIAQFSFTA